MIELIEQVYEGVKTQYEHVAFIKPPADKTEFSTYVVDSSHSGSDVKLGIVTHTVSIEVYSNKNQVTDTQKQIEANLLALSIEFDVSLTVRTERDQTFMTLITFTHTEKRRS